MPIFRFALTGGPCSGKSTALKHTLSYFATHHPEVRVFTTPEAATMLFSNGITFAELDDPKCIFEFQVAVISTQMALENIFERYGGNTAEVCVVLCDRGLMDGAAYIEKEKFDIILKERDVHVVAAREVG